MTATQPVHQMKIINAYGPGTPSTAAPQYVSMKNYNHLTIVLSGLNATTVTGSAVTLLQATAVAGTSAKALAFSKQWANNDAAAGDTLTETAVTSNTFTTLTTNSKRYLHVIEIDAEMLDMDNGFDCVKVALADATATTLTAVYILSGCRHAGNVAVLPTAITD
jgi:hypothetical protein